jgi:hypothetical protein
MTCRLVLRFAEITRLTPESITWFIDPLSYRALSGMIRHDDWRRSWRGGSGQLYT